MLDSLGSEIWSITLPYSRPDEQNDRREHRLPSQMQHRATKSPSPQSPSASSIKLTCLAEELLDDSVKIMDRPRFTARPRTTSQGSQCSQEESPSQPRQTPPIRVVSSTIKGSHLEKIIENNLSSKDSHVSGEKGLKDQKGSSQLRKQETPIGTRENTELLPSVSRRDHNKRVVNSSSVDGLNAAFNVRSRNSRKLASSLPASPKRLIQEHPSKRPGSAPSTLLSTTFPQAKHNVQGRDTSREKDTAEHSETVEQKRLYVPGPIRLEPGPPPPRRDSAASLDHFVSDFASKDPDLSDMMGVDNIVEFFEEFGGIEEATAGTLDQYWLRRNQIYSHTDSWRKTHGLNTEKPLPKIHQKSLRAPISMFSFSTSSLTSPVSPTETTMRQRISFRKWLSPALPGSTIPRPSTASV